MRNAFGKDTVRSIGHSLGRFLAIACIVALGCGFYAGLRMTGPDMRSNADAFYDGTVLYDLRLVSSLGWNDDMISTVRATQGVDAVQAAKACDVVAKLRGEQCTVRISDFNEKAAAAGDTTDGIHAVSDDSDYLNRSILVQGRWPTSPDECVISADRVTSNPVQLGDTVAVEYGTQDLDGVLSERTFTVVGTVHSSMYVSASTLGATSLGSGELQVYIFVPTQAFSADYPTTELYVTVAGAREEFAGSAAYQSTVDDVRANLEENEGIDALAQMRAQQLRADAQATLDDERERFETQKTDAYAQLDDAAALLDAAQAKLDAAAADLVNGRAELASGQQAYDEGLARLVSSRAQGQEKLDATYDTLMASQVESNAARTQLDATEAALKAAWAALDEQSPTYAGEQAALQAQQAEYDRAREAFEAGAARLAAGWAEYNQQGAAATEQILQAQAQLESSAAQLEDARAQLSSGQREYDSGLAEYDRGRAELAANRAQAEDELADAQRKIDEAQADIDALEAPDIYVLDRTKNMGVESFKSDSERVDNIAAVFPFIFFLVAALVALTTMTRMVNEERILIGTYKALGFSRARITSKYLVYAAVASVAGSVVGIGVLTQVLPAVICEAYTIIYNVPQPPLPLSVDGGLAFLSAGMGIGITLVATWASATATLRESPSTLMLPRAPVAGKRVLAERITFIWRRLSFSWKVTLRNLFRYKKRLAMTIIGIGGCTALLLTGLGLSDAINDIIDKQFGPILKYNVVVTANEDATTKQVDDMIQAMRDTGDVTDCTRVAEINKLVASASHEDTLPARAVVVQDADAISQAVGMRGRSNQVPIAFDEDSVVITEKLATTLQVGVGDSVLLYDQSDIGDATGKPAQITVTAVMENYVGNQLYVGSRAYSREVSDVQTFTSVLATCTTDKNEREVFGDIVRSSGVVDTIAYNDEAIDSYRTMLSSVNMIVVVLVVAAAALAFIVLYNLTNINITERQREIASLKVLGFTAGEVDAYIFREIALLTVLGAALGLVLGVFLEGFVVVTAEVNQVMFGRQIHAASFGIAFALTLVFAAFVCLVMRRKLNHIDMVESLKSVD